MTGTEFDPPYIPGVTAVFANSPLDTCVNGIYISFIKYLFHVL